MEYGDMEMPSCSTQKIRVARKIHKCCECRNEIKIGEKYDYISGVWNGSASSFKRCLICVEVSGKMETLTDHAVGLGCLREAFSDTQGVNDTYESWAKSLGISVEKVKHCLGDKWFGVNHDYHRRTQPAADC